ncbi:MAG: hypothetical protein ACYC1M_08390 [Armatimonadota bacterium]
MNDEAPQSHSHLVGIVSAGLVGMLAGVIVAAQIAVIDSNSGYIPPSQTELCFPGMFSSGLTTAILADLPEGVLARSGKLVVKESDLGVQQIKDPSMLRRVEDRLPMILESKCMQTFELGEARQWAAANKIAANAPLDMLQSAYFQHLYSSIEVNSIEMLNALYVKRQVDLDTNLAQKIIDANDFVYQRKKSRMLYDYFQLMGQRCEIELDRKWANSIYTKLLDRSEIRQIDAVRRSHKPSVVFFTAPRGDLKPLVMVQNEILDRFKNKVNTLIVSYGMDPVISGRYGINSLFTSIVYDRQGDEFVRYPDYTTGRIVRALNAALASR